MTEQQTKLFENIVAYKSNKHGIAELPHNGDGFETTEDRRENGYDVLKQQGLITFDEKNKHLSYADITVL